MFMTKSSLLSTRCDRLPAPAFLIILLDFTRLVWAGAIGFLVFAELPDDWTWAGSGLIVVSTVYIMVRREGRLATRGQA